MNVAVILAGGIGTRMGQSIPKQFMEVYGKPVIVYTIEAFQNHPLIDHIEVVCVKEYQEQIWEYQKKYNLTKLKFVVEGGENCQASIRNGNYHLEGFCQDSDLLIYHMAACPLVSEDLITDCIRVAEKYGNANSTKPVLDYTFCVKDENCSESYIPRENIKLLTMPCAYHFGEMNALYKRAYAEGRGVAGNLYTDTLYCDYHMPVYFSKSSPLNIKVTTPEDIDLMKAILQVQGRDCHSKEEENE